MTKSTISMTYVQLSIMDNITHLYENNKESQEILEQERPRLNRVCLQIWKLLDEGHRLSGRDVIMKLGVVEYRKRFDELEKAGYPVVSEKIPGGKGAKVWYKRNKQSG